MSSNSRFYYSLPTEAPRSRSGSRRPPLTPSTVSSPLLTTHAPMVTRRDSGSGSPTKASVLLAKVASQPTTHRGETPTTSPMSSPTQRTVELHSSPIYTPDRPSLWRSESARYVRQYRYQDGYISFPDFEKFCSSHQNPYEQHRESAAVKT